MRLPETTFLGTQKPLQQPEEVPLQPARTQGQKHTHLEALWSHDPGRANQDTSAFCSTVIGFGVRM